MASPAQPSASIFRSIPMPGALHIPAPAAGRDHPLPVKPVGSTVQAGEQLTLERTETDATALAPVAGTIAGTGRAMLWNGDIVDAIELHPDKAAKEVSTPLEEIHLRAVLRFTDLGSWIDHLLKAGVSAFRTCSPDLIGQLYQCLTRPIDTVLCCVLDSDPNLPLNAAVAESFPAELASGIDLLSKLTGARRVWVVADPTVPNNWFSSLDPLIVADGLQLVPLRGDYPQAHPTILLHTLTDRKLRPGRLPVEQGVLMLDASAAVAIGRFVLHDQPMLQVPIAVRDHVGHQTRFLNVPIGTSLTDICRFIGVPSDDVRLRGGDFLRDQLLTAIAVAGAGELVVHIAAREIAFNPDPCVRCAWCVDACPTRIQPAGLLEAAQRNDPHLADRFGIDSCIECGICSFVCPSRLPLLASIRTLRANGFVAAPAPVVA